MKTLKISFAGLIICNVLVVLCVLFVNLSFESLNIIEWSLSHRLVYLVGFALFEMCFLLACIDYLTNDKGNP